LFDFEKNSRHSSPALDDEEIPFEESDEEEEEEPSKPDSPDLKKLLMEKLNSVSSAPKPKPPKPLHWDVKKTVQVDSQVLNFGQFYPEKLLGSILMVSNLTDEDQVIELSIDNAQIYDSSEIVDSGESDFKYLKELMEEQDQKIEKSRPSQNDVIEYEKYLKVK